MAINLYDATLEALDDQEPSPPKNLLQQTLDEITADHSRSLRVATMQARDTTPDRAVQVRQLSGTLGLPQDVVERNFDSLSKRAVVETTPYDAMLQQTPKLAEWASDPHNAAIAKDDMERLGFLEWIVKAPSAAYAKTTLESRAAQLRTRELLGEPLTQQQYFEMEELQKAAQQIGAAGAGDSWFKGAVTGAGNLLANFVEGMVTAAPEVAIGTGVGAVVGGVGGGLATGGAGILPGLRAGAALGARVGGLVGGAKYTFQIEAGNAYDEYRTFKDELGRPLDRETARAAAFAAGSINAVLEVGGIEMFLRTIPGIKDLGKKGVREVVKSALRNPTIRAQLVAVAKDYGKTLTGESFIEAAQRYSTILSGEFGKVAAGPNIPLRTPGDIAGDVAREFGGALQSFSLGLAIMPTVGLVHDAQRAVRATQNEHFFAALGEGVSQSKTVQRMPEAAQAFLAQATKDGPVETLYAPVDTFTTYWQSKGLDPAIVAQELTGKADALEVAQRTGEDLAIPTAAYAVKVAGTEHNAFFAQELRLAPDEMNAREATAFRETLTRQMDEAKQRQAEGVQVAAPSQTAPIHVAILQQLEQAGVPSETATNYATLVESAIGTMAERAGVNPVALYNRYRLRVQRPDLQSASVNETAPAVVRPAVVGDAGAAATPLVAAPASSRTAPAVSGMAVAQPTTRLAPASDASRAHQPASGQARSVVDGLLTLSQDRRGSITFGPDRQATITLLERADLSSFLHEGGHFFLEVFSDLADQLRALDPATLTAEQRQQLADYDATLKFLGIENRAGLSTDQHETFARAFESYLMEGKAPSVALRSTFARFRAWLIGIYRTLAGLGVKLSDDVRGVFDRILTSDQAIAEAEAAGKVEAMFTTPESAGMDAATFGLYSQTVADASRIARETLERQALTEVQREQTDQWKAQRAEIEQAVTTEVHQEPVYAALWAIRKGTRPDGSALVEGQPAEPLHLSRAILVERYGEARLKRLPPFTYAKEGGLDPDVVAGQFGFSSGDEMLTAISQAPAMSKAIGQEANRRMLQQHGSLLLDGSLHEKAQAAVANESREQVVRQELRALAKLKRIATPFERAGKAAVADAETARAYERRWFEAEAKLRIAIAEGRKQTEIDELQDELQAAREKTQSGPSVIDAAIPRAADLRQMAVDRIARTRIRDINPQAFWSASRRSAQLAIDAAARQDFDAAIVAKQQELLTLALYREAMRVKEDVQKRVGRAKDLAKPAARERLGKAGESYLDQVDGILDRYEFAPVSRTALDRRASLRKWVAAQEADGIPVDLPEQLLEETRRVNWQELTVEELVGVTDGLQQIMHLARLKNRLLKLQQGRALDTAATAIDQSIRANTPAKALPLEFGPREERRRSIADVFASLAKISLLSRALDGYKDGGEMWSSFVMPLNQAADWEQTRKGKAGEAYWAILRSHYAPMEYAHFGRKTFIRAINASLTTEARLAVALNWGNQTSRDRILSDPSRRWTEPQVEAILDTLDERDWRFVQATWDFLDTFWPEIAAKQERVTGVAPEKVAAEPVSTKFGVMPGGYYPLAYDARLSPRAARLAEAETGKTLLQAAYVSSTTRRGHVETRVSHLERPVRLDLGVAFGHLDQVIHDLAYHETLIDLSRLLRDKRVAEAIYETRGDAVYHQFTEMLKDAATGTAPATNRMDKAANWMRTGTQISLLGFNFWTALQQPLGMFNGMARVGPVWVMRGLGRWLRDAAHMEATTTWIAEVSPLMRDRVTNATQDISELRSALRQPGGWFDALVREVSRGRMSTAQLADVYLWHIGMAQRVADVPTWLGQYMKAMAEPTEGLTTPAEHEARAIALADQVVRDFQGTWQVQDLAHVQRGGPVARLFMVFYSYGNVVFNSTAEIVGRTNFRKPGDVASMLGGLSLLYLMPAMATVALGQLVGRKPPSDEPDKWVKQIAQESIGTAMNSVVFLRELGQLAQDGTRGYAGPAGMRMIQAVYGLGQQVKQGEFDEGLWKAVNSTAGILFRYPALQVQRSIDGVVALSEGTTSNPMALVSGKPLKK
ncbi:MAG: hypothetical protein NT151_09955 [Acidobacteria bacterium]|nr:hypothetical protein [Acidobacteriota bacterium]